MADDIPFFDPATFQNDEYLKKVDKPWGYELHWVPEGLPYMGKLLHIEADKRLSMQVHDAKQEAYFLIKGRAKIIWDNDKGELIETELKPMTGYRTSVGQRHRLCGITDCDIIESSTPESGTTYRLDDDYARPDETPEQRAVERGESE
jgi:mannose-6-phosphate isomerase-like protein (cupin superfamily)